MVPRAALPEIDTVWSSLTSGVARDLDVLELELEIADVESDNLVGSEGEFIDVELSDIELADIEFFDMKLVGAELVIV